MKKPLLSALAAALLIGGSAVQAQKAEKPTGGAKPVAVVSLSGYDEIMGDIAFFGKLADNPDMAKSLEGLLTFMTQGQGLKGLDKSRPWGMALTTDGQEFQPLAFIPVTNLKQLLGALAAFVGEPQNAGEGVSEIQAGPQKVYVKEQNGWAFVAQNTEALVDSKLPKDPSKLLGGLEKQYDVALRFYVQNIPEMYRSLAIDQIKMAVQNSAERQGDEDEAEYDLRKKMTQNQIQAIETAVNDTDQITFGWAIDQKTKSSYADVHYSAVPGSKMAKQLADVEDMKSDYTGFMAPEAAATMNFVGKVDKESAEQAVSTLKTMKAAVSKEVEKSNDLTDDEKATVKDVAGELMNVFVKTLHSGKLDGGLAVALDSNALTLAGGTYVADPAAVETSLKKLLKIAEKQPDFPTVKFDADKHGDVRFHTLSINVPKEEKIARVLGDKLDVAIGIGKESVYLAAGTNCLETLKGAIDKSADGKKIHPAEIRVSLEPIFKFASALEDNPTLNMMSAELAKESGKDHITFSVKAAKKNGMMYRFEVEEGVLRLIGHASKLAGGQAQLQGAQ